jgi:predicted Zn-dependent protease
VGYRYFDLFLCGIIFFASLYVWGRFKRFIAIGKLRDAKNALGDANFRKAICICQGITDDMQYDSEFWYVLAVAFAGAGSSEDAGRAIEKALALEPSHRKGRELMEIIRSKYKK